jgi:hypothetical protein
LQEILRRRANDYELQPAWFHAHQSAAWRSESPIIAICAGWQSGKTVFLPPWLKREIKRKGPGDYGAFSSTYRLLSRKFLPELKKEFKDLTEFRASDQQFIFTEAGSRRLWGPDWNGEPTVIQLGHAENPDTLESATLKAVAWDEPGQRLVPEQSFLTVESRLMVNRGRMALASRPYESGWYERLVKSSSTKVFVVSFPSWANPVNPPEFDEHWADLRSRIPAWKFKMLYEGVFTKPAGLIYETFDYELDTCQDFPVPHDWKRYPMLDFGSVNTGGLVLAEDPHSKELFGILDYLSPGKRKMAEHATELRKAGALTVGAGGAHSEEGWREAAAAAGIYLDEPPINDVETQIQCVFEQLAIHKLKFFRQACAGTISDIENFARELDDNGEVTEKIAGHEPHRLAGLRYGVTKLRPPLANETVAATYVPSAVPAATRTIRPSWDLTGRTGR